MWNLKQNRKELTDKENRLAVARGGEQGKGWAKYMNRVKEDKLSVIK